MFLFVSPRLGVILIRLDSFVQSIMCKYNFFFSYLIEALQVVRKQQEVEKVKFEGQDISHILIKVWGQR